MISFHKNYFLPAVLLFLAEIIIALYVHDGIVRPCGGDFLVVILLYCFFKSFLNAGNVGVALSVLVFSYIMETLQYFHIIQILGFQNSRLAQLIIGTSFAWTDILAYTLGITLVLAIEKINKTS